MARAAARRDAGRDGIGEAKVPLGRQGIQVGRPGRIQLCLAVQSARESSKTIQYQQDDLGLGRTSQGLQVIKGNHRESASGPSLTFSRRDAARPESRGASRVLASQ